MLVVAGQKGAATSRLSDNGGWMNIDEAALYAGRSKRVIYSAVQENPLTGKPELTHTRGGKGKLLFRRDWLDQWNLRRVRHADQGPSL